MLCSPFPHGVVVYIGVTVFSDAQVGATDSAGRRDTARDATEGGLLTLREAAMLGFTLEHFLAEDADSLDPIGDEFEQHSHYLHRCRRVQVGRAVTVVFENARTLRLRLRELARFAKATQPNRIHREVSWYDSLLPGHGRLLASVSVRAANRELVRRLDCGVVELRIGSRTIPGRVRSDSGGDRVIGLVRWVEFDIDRADRAALTDRTQPLSMVISAGDEFHESDPFPAAVRSSLLADLDPQKN